MHKVIYTPTECVSMTMTVFVAIATVFVQDNLVQLLHEVGYDQLHMYSPGTTGPE